MQSLTSQQAQSLSPVQWSYIGDAVYELHVRLHYLLPPRRIKQYHEQVVAHVRAEHQAEQLQRLLPQLTEDEKEIVRRGRNAAVGKPRRLNAEIYGQASGFEALLGYLHLTDPGRLQLLLGYLLFE